MRGNRDPCNILLESDCCVHESLGESFHARGDDDEHSNHSHQHFLPPPQRYYLEGCTTSDKASDLQSPSNRRHCASHDEFYARKTSSDIHHKNFRPTEYGEQFSKWSTARNNNLRNVRPTEYGEQFTRGPPIDNRTKSAWPGECREQFRRGIVENVSINNDRPHLDDYSWREPEDARSRNIESRGSREKPKSTSFSCNDCKEPQCLHCWRKSRENAGDFSFLDGFDSQETAWRPGRKVVEQFGDDGHKSSRMQAILSRDVPSPGPKWKSDACQPSQSGEEPKWKPSNFLESHGAQQHETTEKHCKRQESTCRENELQWHLGKGRGMGPIPGEWLPPFRAHSTAAESQPPPFTRSKGVGQPTSDEWVPPFRGDDQPYNWHRCKGTGGCIPRDQWLAPWCDPNEKERVDQVYGGSRRDGSFSEYPEGNRFWRQETREVY